MPSPRSVSISRWHALLLAFVVAVLSVVTSSRAQPQATAETPRPALPQLVGVDVPVPHLNDLPAAVRQLERVRELGANAVRFVVPVFQPHAASPAPRLHQRPGRGPTDTDLIAIVQAARKLGLHTALTPRVAFTAARPGDRVADLSPRDWERWWIAYAQATVHYARLADRAGVAVLGLGDGLESVLDPRRHRGALDAWDALIADVRDVYAGPIVVFADASRAAVSADAWNLDGIGVRPALRFDERDLRDTDRRDRAMDRQWTELRNDLRRAAADQGRPIYVAGVGLPGRSDAWSETGPAYQPFAPAFVEQGVDAKPAVQSTALRGFLSAWSDAVPAPPGSGDASVLAGVFFADWSLTGRGGPFDPGYALQAKPAEAILRRYFSGDHE